MRRGGSMKQLPISEVKKRYAEGGTPAEVISDIIGQAQELSDMNIWITPPDMSFISPYIDKLDSMDRSLPLWGIPFAVKDNIDLAGVPTTAGCPDYSYIPEKSAAAVERLVAAGAIPVGKTNLDQFATGLVGTRSPYGECKNSLAPDYISGGSSSGSAVATATGLCCFALGTDTAGSGRVPAALNELYGVKPSVGAYPKTGLVPACESLDCITVFAYRLDDAMLADSVIRGKCDEDMWSRDVPLTDGIPEKIIIPDSPLEFYGRFEEEYRQSYENAVKKLSEAFTVEKTDCNVFFKAAELLYGGPWICERWSALGGFVENHSESVFPVTREVLLSGKGGEYSAAALFEKQHLMKSYEHRAHRMLENAVLVLPTCGGTFTRDEVRESPIEANRKMGLYTNHCNLLDLAALAIPMKGFESNGEYFPFGITLFATPEYEGILRSTASILNK